MDSRERIFLSLDFQQPDRVPIDLWLSGGMWAKLERERHISKAAFLDAHDIDLRYIDGPRYIGPPLRTFTDGSHEDLWGVRRRTVELFLRDSASGEGIERYQEVSTSPLQGASTPEEIDAYAHWPSADWFDYSGIEQQCEAVRAAGRVAVFQGDRLNRIAQLKPAMYLRGIEQILLDMSLNPEIAHAIIRHIRAFYRAYAERIYSAANGKLDLVLTGDDFGSQNGPLLSPAMWTDYIAPGFAEYVGLAHSHGLRVMHHTCGGVHPLVPLMQRCGLDVLQSLQPEAHGMELADLKADHGTAPERRLAFQGGLSIQRTLPFGTPASVRTEVRHCIETMAPGGGYILGTAHNIQADTSLVNLDALLAAHRDYGAY
jgi:uroporphyrinogen decarboxylase